MSSCSSDFDLLSPVDSYDACNKLPGNNLFRFQWLFCVSRCFFLKNYYVNKVNSFYWTQIKLSTYSYLSCLVPQKMFWWKVWHRHTKVVRSFLVTDNDNFGEVLLARIWGPSASPLSYKCEWENKVRSLTVQTKKTIFWKIF